jgi:hypothetical protein
MEAIVPGVSKMGRMAEGQQGILYAMDKRISILKVERDGEDGLIVTFSDGTIGGYVVEELIELRPIREHAEEPVDSN